MDASQSEPVPESTALTQRSMGSRTSLKVSRITSTSRGFVARSRPNHLLKCLRGSRRAPSDDCDSVSWKRAIGSLASSALNVLVHCSTFLASVAWRRPAYVGSSWRVRYNRSMSARMSMRVDKKNRLMSDTAALASSSEPIFRLAKCS